ncbi:MAG TPA: helix-turn-helix domain-containing protein, partial [Pyrinomonadaceae bacterium]|nr:helix-turn-helix domain-containing protein [Pyrinomonadaceae bacterium]
HTLEVYSWPGNIRELKNCIQYLTCLRPDDLVTPHELPLLTEDQGHEESITQTFVIERPLKEVKRELVSKLEREYLQEALRQNNGNIARAARASGKPRRAFFQLMKKYGIKPAELVGDEEEVLTGLQDFQD